MTFFKKSIRLASDISRGKYDLSGKSFSGERIAGLRIRYFNQRINKQPRYLNPLNEPFNKFWMRDLVEQLCFLKLPLNEVVAPAKDHQEDICYYGM